MQMMSCMSLYNIQASRDCWPGSFKTRPLLWTTFEGKRRNLKVNVDAAQFPAFSRIFPQIRLLIDLLCCSFPHFPSFSRIFLQNRPCAAQTPRGTRRFPQIPAFSRKSKTHGIFDGFAFCKMLTKWDEQGSALATAYPDVLTGIRRVTSLSSSDCPARPCPTPVSS